MLPTIGAVYLGVNQVEDAIKTYQKLVSASIEKYGEVHEQTALAYAALARAYRRVGDLPASEEFARKALVIDREVYPVDHWVIANHLNALEMTLIEKRDFDGALAAAQESYAIATRTLDENDQLRVSQQHAVGQALSRLERYQEAVPLLREAMERRARSFGETARETTHARQNYGYALAMAGGLEQGAAALARAAEEIRQWPEPDFSVLSRTIEKRIRVALLRGRTDEALGLIAALHESAQKVPKTEQARWCGKSDLLKGRALYVTQHYDEAIQRAERLAEIEHEQSVHG